MGYNIENYRRVRAAFEERRRAALDTADRHAAEVHAKIPELREIDRALSTTGMQLFREAMAGGDDLAERLARIRAEHENIQKMREELLLANGFPAGYTEPAFSCDKCHDTGFFDASMCACMREALVEEGIRSSGIGRLIHRQSFDNFSLDYYRDDPTDFDRAEYALSRARSYAEGFGPESGNLLLVGATGLGKTHISTAIAKVVLERGYDVVYETVGNLISDFEYDRYKSGYGASEVKGERYLACELLLLDDLGTEQTNSFVISTLYHLINTRLNHGKQTVINTNLKGDELSERYGDRIASRLLGEYEVLFLSGHDIRMQKL